MLRGGDGFDTAFYENAFSQYQFDYVGGDLWVTDEQGDTDTFSGVERLQFADGRVRLSVQQAQAGLLMTA